MKTDVIVKNIEMVAAKQGVSISALERKAGLARGHFYKLKSCTSPQLETINRLAEALGVSLSTLLRERKE